MENQERRPAVIRPGSAPWFPHPDDADPDGLVAIGGDLDEERLLLAYDLGLFPWYDSGIPPLWWSPDPRCVLDLETLHVSSSMRRELRRGRYRVSWNRAFGDVMQGCSERAVGTWILPETVEAYTRLHEHGHAHSIEVWHDASLVGGLYGVQRGGLFAAESMFHRETNASKVALIAAVRSLFRTGIMLFDVQLPTAHLRSLGAYCIPRSEYLARLRVARTRVVRLARLALTL